VSTTRSIQSWNTHTQIIFKHRCLEAIFNFRSIEYIYRFNYIRHNWHIFSVFFFYQTNRIDQRREQKGEKEKTDKNIVKKRKKDTMRIERKYKTKHIHTSWYAPLDSFIFLRLCTFELLQSIWSCTSNFY